MSRKRSGFRTFRIARPGPVSWPGWSVWKFLRDGVNELRIDWGPGYRVYFARDGRTVVVLLCGGDKRKQGTDITRAVKLWQEYLNRKNRDPRAKG